MRNFGRVRDSEVLFPDRGFVLVTGRNHTGFESNGSGKTLLGEALNRTLFNVPGRFTRYGEYSTNDEGNTYVKVEAVLDGKDIVVEQGYKCAELSRGGEGLRFTIGNQTPVMYGNIKDTRQELLRMFGVQPDVAAWTVFVDGGALNFESLSESKAVNLLMGALNQPPWTDYYKKAVKVKAKFEAEHDKAVSVHNSVKLALEQATSGLNQAKLALAQAEKEYTVALAALEVRRKERDSRKTALHGQADTIEVELRRIQGEIDAATAAEAEKYHEAETTAMRCSSTLAESQRLHAKLEREHGAIQRQHEQLKTNKQAAITEYNTKAYAEANAERNALLAKISQVEKSNSKAKKDWDAKEKDLLKEYNEAKFELNTATAQQETAQATLTREKDAPCTCPLPGCGKPWPKTNQAAVKRATEAYVVASKRYVDVTNAEKAASEAYAGFMSTHPHQENVPVAPEEKPIASFPDELAWVDQIEAHALQVELKRQELESQITVVSLNEAKVTEAQDNLTKLKQASSITGLSKQYEQAEIKFNGLNIKLNNLQMEIDRDIVDSKEVDLAKVRESERDLAVKQHEARLAETAQEVSDSFEYAKIANYWVEAFGATGIPNMIIDETIAPLNAISKQLGLRMTNGIIEIVYGTQRQLNSGESSNELTINVNNKFGSKSVHGSSKGERGIVNLVIAETLAEIGNIAARVNYAFYDEITQSADPKLRRDVFSYLREKATNRLMFVVDHALEVASYADKVLIADKSPEGITTYAWQ